MTPPVTIAPVLFACGLFLPGVLEALPGTQSCASGIKKTRPAHYHYMCGQRLNPAVAARERAQQQQRKAQGVDRHCRDVWSEADRVASDGGPLALQEKDVLVHVDGKSHDRQFSAIWTAKGAPAAPTEAAMWAADIRQNAQICVWVVKPVRCRTHARGDARLKEQIASVARAAIGQRRRAGNLDFPAVLAIALHIAV